MENEANRAFERSGLTPNLLDKRDSESGAAGFSKHRDNDEAMSATEKARELPRRMWMMVAAAVAAWALVLALAYFILA